MATQEQILNALRQVMDPDLHKDLVSLGMIEDLRIEGKHVSFKVVLTTPACPLKGQLQQNCIKAIHELVSPDLVVEPEMTSRVTTIREKTSSMMAHVKNIIAVSSGKGGVGKSTIAANLAVALAKSGAKVGLLDADIYGPSQPLMFGLTDIRPRMIKINGRDLVEPIEKYGVKVLSIGFFVEPDKALVWRGPWHRVPLPSFLPILTGMNSIIWSSICLRGRAIFTLRWCNS